MLLQCRWLTWPCYFKEKRGGSKLACRMTLRVIASPRGFGIDGFTKTLKLSNGIELAVNLS